MTKTFLKVKIKSLADETIIIKQEEAKWKEAPYTEGNLYYTHPMYFALRMHRIHEVRTECRSASIAYGYMRGRAYREIENKCHEQPNWARVEEIIRKFSGTKYLASIDRAQLHEDVKAWASLEPEPVEVEEDTGEETFEKESFLQTALNAVEYFFG